MLLGLMFAATGILVVVGVIRALASTTTEMDNDFSGSHANFGKSLMGDNDNFGKGL